MASLYVCERVRVCRKNLYCKNTYTHTYAHIGEKTEKDDEKPAREMEIKLNI